MQYQICCLAGGLSRRAVLLDSRWLGSGVLWQSLLTGMWIPCSWIRVGRGWGGGWGAHNCHVPIQWKSTYILWREMSLTALVSDPKASAINHRMNFPNTYSVPILGKWIYHLWMFNICDFCLDKWAVAEHIGWTKKKKCWSRFCCQVIGSTLFIWTHAGRSSGCFFCREDWEKSLTGEEFGFLLHSGPISAHLDEFICTRGSGSLPSATAHRSTDGLYVSIWT